MESLDKVNDPKLDELTEKKLSLLLVFKYDNLPLLLINPIKDCLFIIESSTCLNILILYDFLNGYRSSSIFNVSF